MSRNKKKRSIKPLIAALGIIIVIVGIALAVIITKYGPSNTQADLSSYFSLTEGQQEAGQAAVVLNNEIIESKALINEGSVYINIDTVTSNLNSRFYWDSNEQLLIYTTPTDVIQTGVGTADYYISNALNTYGAAIVINNNDSYYVNADFVKEYTAMEYTYYDNDIPRVVINSVYGSKSYVTAKKSSVAVRYQGGIKSDVLTTVSQNASLEVKEEFDNWYEVATEDGYIGYVKKSQVSEITNTEVTSDYTEPEYTHISLGKTVNLTWHQVTSQTANNYISSTLAEAVGINVISPTWFYLNDDEGGISNIASASYVTYCHNKGIQVWGLVSNVENTSVDTSAVLGSTTNRNKLESKLISAAIEYKLDGINIDFESISADTAASYIQFIREMSILCRKNGIILSVDTITPAQSPVSYDWKEMGTVADYVILMAYDEHYAGSEAGSVASLSWTREGANTMLKYVSADQLVLGVPFYSRLYKIYSDGTVDSEARGMTDVNDFIIRNEATSVYDETTEQNYVEFVYNDTTYQLWIEDETSMAKRLQIITDNSLAGIASWKVGLETNSIWSLISTTLFN